MSGALQERIESIERAPQDLAVYQGPIEQIAILATPEAHQDTVAAGYKWDPAVTEPVGWEPRFHDPIVINRFDGTVHETPRTEALLGYILQYVSPGYVHRSDVVNIQPLRRASSVERQSIRS